MSLLTIAMRIVKENHMEEFFIENTDGYDCSHVLQIVLPIAHALENECADIVKNHDNWSHTFSLLLSEIEAKLKSEIPPIPPIEMFPSSPDFSFITDSFERTMIETGYTAVCEVNGWKTLQNFTGDSFMFSTNPEVTKITDAICKLYEGHSGSSMGHTVRQLEYISHIGFFKYKSDYINAQRKR